MSQLRREIGLGGACLLGLGSILGSGVFVSLAIGAEVAGFYLLPAIGVAALVALCNGLSSAQLAAAFPQSGGTYEFGYRLLHPAAGFTAGWMFLVAKSATAATAALAVSAYLLGAGDHRAAAAGCVLLLTALVLGGVRRSNVANALMVGITVLVLGTFVATLMGTEIRNRVGQPPIGPEHFLQACALMFVAFTGYGRIATMGEEVIDPRKTIPRAIILTLALTAALYLAVAYAAMRPSALFFENVADPRRPLAELALAIDLPWLATLLGVGAVAAMLGVLLNLLLGLSRVLLAMGRRRDVPAVFAKVDKAGTTPAPAVMGVAAIVLVLVLIGDVKIAWSISAFTVLVYYGLTNLCCLRLPDEHRLYPRAFAWAGLASCFFLAFWVGPRFWLTGLGLVAGGLFWQFLAFRLRGADPAP